MEATQNSSLKASSDGGDKNTNTSFNGELDFNRSTSFHEELALDDSDTPKRRMSRRDFWEELKLQCRLTAPLTMVWFLQVAFQVIAIMFVGHLGELALSSSSIAISIANVTGVSVMMGMAGGLETLCGQAFGAKQYRLLGLYLQTGLICLNTLAIFLSFMYYYMDKILIALGQDQLISDEAGKFIRYLIPYLFAHASAQPLIRFLQTQSKVYPMMVCPGIAVAFDVPLSWFLVYKTGFGFTGAALSVSISTWINAILLYAYVIFSPSCSETRAPLSLRALHSVRSFITLAVPSAAMICLEWWCYEILVLLSGLLPNPELQTSTLSTSLNIANLIYMIPFGLSATVSTRVSNELGAGNARAAYNAVLVAMSLIECEGCVMSLLVLSFHKVLGHLFSSDGEVIENVAAVLQLVAISSLLDNNQSVLSGVVRGCGRQALGSVINLGSFYIVALPVGICLAFLTPLQTRGLWIGVICGPFVQTIFFGTLIWLTKWENEVEKVRQIAESSSSTSPLLLQ